MSVDVLFSIALIALVFVVVGNPWLRPALQWLASKFVWKHGVLTWSAPNAKAQGALLTFFGVEIGHFFIGAITSQMAQVDFPVETPMIVKP